jgi:L-rhamnose mutarotase
MENFFLLFQIQNKLKHEEAFTRLNLAKINQQWRQILRQIKTKELKQELEVTAGMSDMNSVSFRLA